MPVINPPQSFAESKSQKLRRLMARARESNAVLNSPLVGSVPWSPSTAYPLGAVVSNNGKAYSCATAGTSASSGGPSGRGTGITDNTAFWDYIGPQTAPLRYGSPSIPSQLTSRFTNTSAQFRYGAGAPVSISGGYEFYGVNAGVNGSGDIQNGNGSTQNALISSGFFVEFETDAPIVCFDVLQTTLVYVNFTVRDIAGGPGAIHYVDSNTFLPNAGSGHSYIVIDFTNSGGRRPRRIRMESSSTTRFFGINLQPIDSLWIPSTSDAFRVAWLGDSWTQGYTQSTLGRELNFCNVACHLLGVDDCWKSGASATGFTVSTASIPLTFPQRVSDVAGVGANLIVVHGGVNDGAATPTQIQAAALSVIQGIRALTSVPIVMAGCNDPSGATAIMGPREDAVAAAVAQSADPLTYYLPIIRDPAGQWVTGTGNTGSPGNDGNASVYLGTNSHPNDAGYLYLGRKWAAALGGIFERAAW